VWPVLAGKSPLWDLSWQQAVLSPEEEELRWQEALQVRQVSLERLVLQVGWME
jgi:hypothetical protein